MKCNAVKGKWCKAIKQVAQFADPVSKGLCAVDVMDIKTYDKGHGLLYRMKSNSNNYVWLNFCPFCGADVSKRTETKRKKK